MKRSLLSLLLAVIISYNCNNNTKTHGKTGETKKITNKITYEQEKHLKNIRQLSFGGDNAEAYWSFDGSKLVFQSNNPKWGVECDQIYIMNALENKDSNSISKMISNGDGRTTCSYFLKGDSMIVYASTHESHKNCPPKPGMENGYVWPIYPEFEIYIADINGKIKKNITNNPGYDAEATVSPLGDKIVFTSTRSGDLELYTMNIDGSNVKQITKELGYDGGAFFSPDGKKIIFRSSRPTTNEDISTYKKLLSKNLVMPSDMELYMCNVDGSELKKITNLGHANWAPFFNPKGDKVIFCSNHKSKKGFPFNLFMIDTNGQNLEQITYDSQFDSFPMFSPDGKKIVFASNRNNGGTRETNLFVADWID